jgi:hypothetical protein
MKESLFFTFLKLFIKVEQRNLSAKIQRIKRWREQEMDVSRHYITVSYATKSK